SGRIPISGRIRDVRGFEVDKVEVKEGKNNWKEAEGTVQWTYEMDTTRHPNGELDIRIRYTVNDVEDIQTETVITVQINNESGGGVDWVPIVIGAIILIVIIVIILVLFRRKKRNWDDLLPPPAPGPRMPPMAAPGGLPPARMNALPAAQTPRITDAPGKIAPPAEEKQRQNVIRVKCPACSRVFKVTDTGDRPLHMTCKHCGATGTIDHVPGDLKDGSKEGAPSDKEEDEKEAPESVPIVCPSCQNLFELDQVTDTAKCPICGAEGDLDEETMELLEERFGEGPGEEFTLRCPSCAGTFKARSASPSIICPYCGAKGKTSS
ncbi:MAG: hypothetical protein JW939_04785, partial [Candidatus Thermoplasmatota archaeon]|nr:hypothetical protein [Candidatus Thermoplasmatota archaeon]